jgi:selenocysteine-specific elongation factor
MRVIGTAGHVDHGKSTLVEALTGIHPDRLKEEREREMTIDLGFAWMTLPAGGEEVGIVDVPGHRDFIENMLSGVGGIDAVLFVVAADEGVMPQTREHLAILNLLQIQGGVVALTKVDLIEDQDWLDLVEDDLSQLLAGTILASAPIIRVSARTKEGLPALLEALVECLKDRPARPDLGRPRLPIDRVFSIAGFGTVVTGTLSDGQLRVGDEVEILPKRLRSRIRGLQTHKRKEEVAIPGGRTAVNISGVNLEEIQRGDVVAHVGDYHPTQRIDVRFQLLADASRAMGHNVEVKLFLGAAEIPARVRLLGKDVLKPGEEGWLQLELKQPVATIRGDRYILRRPSPGETLGGGVVVEPHPRGRHKRFASGLIDQLESLAIGSPDQILLQAILALGAASVKEIVTRSSLEGEQVSQAVQELTRAGQLIWLEDKDGMTPLTSDLLVTSRSYWDQLAGQTIREVSNYHQAFRLRRGMPREELKSRLRLSTRLFNAILRRLVNDGVLGETGPLIFDPNHEIQFSPSQEKAVQDLLTRFAATPNAPPTIKETQMEIGDEVYNALIDLGILVPVSSEVIFRKQDYDRMLAELHGLFEEQGTLTAAQVRDHFNTSRKYVLALLEHLDQQGMTVREGDIRRLRTKH